MALLAHNSAAYAEAYDILAGAAAVPLNTAADPASLQHFVVAAAPVLIAAARAERVLVPALARMPGTRPDRARSTSCR